METIKIDRDTVVASPGGGEAYFVDLGYGIGLKVYYSREMRDAAYAWQTYLYDYEPDHIPESYGMVDVDVDGSIRPAYLTEVIVADEGAREDWTLPCNERLEQRVELFEIQDKCLKELIDFLDEHDFDHYDVKFKGGQVDNVIIRNGKAVLVDCGLASYEPDFPPGWDIR